MLGNCLGMTVGTASSPLILEEYGLEGGTGY